MTRRSNAQQARRVLDRLVGYKASPVLWKTVKKGLSAGRVQTVALRIIVEREREIRAFRPVEYWTIDALLEKDAQKFTAKLHQLDGKKPEIHSAAAAEAILKDLKGRKQFQVTEVQRARAPEESGGAVHHAAPCSRKARRSSASARASDDARGAGSLRGHRGRQGRGLGRSHHVHAHRLHARVADRGATGARLPAPQYGEDSLSAGPQLYGKAGQANTQDAHEAVRPTDPDAPARRT